MKLDLKEICSSTAFTGQRLFVCDYRKPDLNKKAIRHIKPIEIEIVDESVFRNSGIPSPTVYYSSVGFATLDKNNKPKLKKLISPYDTTGYRSYTGIGINVFDNLEECTAFYNSQIDIVLEQYNAYIQVVLDNLNVEYDEIQKLKQ